jgi:hypothetical protein
MSTRAVIARVKGDGWEGRYHHFDGYPTGLGARLYAVVGQLGVKRALELLVDEHPVGWSSIHDCDITAQPGYGGDFNDQTHGPRCYCHGERHEQAPLLITDQSDDCGCEWAYVLSARGVMTVYERQYSPERWRLVATVRLDEAAPDWAAMETGA